MPTSAQITSWSRDQYICGIVKSKTANLKHGWPRQMDPVIVKGPRLMVKYYPGLLEKGDHDFSL